MPMMANRIREDVWVSFLAHNMIHQMKPFQLCYMSVKRIHSLEDTFTTFEIQTWTPEFILGIKPFRIVCASPI